jgi:hypothetical protein
VSGPALASTSYDYQNQKQEQRLEIEEKKKRRTEEEIKEEIRVRVCGTSHLQSTLAATEMKHQLKPGAAMDQQTCFFGAPSAPLRLRLPEGKTKSWCWGWRR